jgi:cytochrome b
MQEIKVWDLVVRVLHWSLVASVVGAWITREGDDVLHIRLGYAALAIVVARVIGDSWVLGMRGLTNLCDRRERRRHI